MDGIQRVNPASQTKDSKVYKKKGNNQNIGEKEEDSSSYEEIQSISDDENANSPQRPTNSCLDDGIRIQSPMCDSYVGAKDFSEIIDDQEKENFNPGIVISPQIQLDRPDTFYTVYTKYDGFFTDGQPPKMLISSRRFRDPVNKDISVEYKFIADLIDSPEMQRLRRVKQLSNNLVFPGASHDRFNHCLGVYHLANMVHSNISRSFLMRNSEKYNEIKREILDFKESRFFISRYGQCVLLAAALLHDIGHGPYSHAFEKLIATSTENPSSGKKERIKHETIGARGIITNPKSTINKILNSVGPKFAEDVAKIIEKESEHTPIVQLISSNLDVDRLDYLQRDSKFCGVSYGEVDISRIISSLKLRFGHICYRTGESGGISERETLTHYLQARDRMYRVVYFHKISRSFEKVLGFVFKRLISIEAINRMNNVNIYKENLNKNNNDYVISLLLKPFINVVKNSISIKDFREKCFTSYMELDDSYIDVILQLCTNHSDKLLSTLANRIVKRHLFKTFVLELSRIENASSYNSTPDSLEINDGNKKKKNNKEKALEKISELTKLFIVNKILPKYISTISEKLSVSRDKVNLQDIASYMVATDYLYVSKYQSDKILKSEATSGISLTPALKMYQKGIIQSQGNIDLMIKTPCTRSQIGNLDTCGFSVSGLDSNAFTNNFSLDQTNSGNIASQPCNVSIFEDDDNEEKVKFITNRESGKGEEEEEVNSKDMNRYIKDKNLSGAILMISKKAYGKEQVKEFVPTTTFNDTEEYRIYIPSNDEFTGMNENDYVLILEYLKKLQDKTMEELDKELKLQEKLSN